MSEENRGPSEDTLSGATPAESLEEGPDALQVPLNVGERESVYFVRGAGVRPPVGGGTPRRGDVCWGGRPGGHGPAR
ncbi:MAG: hypothetical protein KBD21_04390 [Candidatus Pacebacteria bacterium]|nr:hypothetical protein [Candidatus Paceibacterota bacterium]